MLLKSDFKRLLIVLSARASAVLPKRPFSESDARAVRFESQNASDELTPDGAVSYVVFPRPYSANAKPVKIVAGSHGDGMYVLKKQDDIFLGLVTSTRDARKHEGNRHPHTSI